ncbi:MAG: hypothetical protein IJ770_02245 [Alphaproteobacteria bacterium]|nr:hypothetical protein [Alphaproteobacteria bacterium]
MKNNQNGRSMIEMLGVLAIIGVLSVGGLAGYAKMMAQYRINTTLQQIQIMTSKLSVQGSNGGSYEGLSAYTAYRLGALPSEIVESVDTSAKTATLSNIYAGAVKLEPASVLSGTCGEGCDYQAYTITYTNLPEEACLALGGSTWNSAQNSSMIGFGVGSADNENNIKSELSQDCEGKAEAGIAVACSGSKSKVTVPIDLDTVTDACTCDGSDCVMVLKFF